MLYKPSGSSPSVQVLYQQIWGGVRVNTCADLADSGVGVPDLGKPADVILERSLKKNIELQLYF